MRGGARLALCLLLLGLAACCVAGHGVHPLSRIAVDRARFALDASAAVRASPKLLGSRVRILHSTSLPTLRFTPLSLRFTRRLASWNHEP
jgi:hypothetical protein